MFWNDILEHDILFLFIEFLFDPSFGYTHTESSVCVTIRTGQRIGDKNISVIATENIELYSKSTERNWIFVQSLSDKRFSYGVIFFAKLIKKNIEH